MSALSAGGYVPQPYNYTRQAEIGDGGGSRIGARTLVVRAHAHTQSKRFWRSTVTPHKLARYIHVSHVQSRNPNPPLHACTSVTFRYPCSPLVMYLQLRDTENLAAQETLHLRGDGPRPPQGFDPARHGMHQRPDGLQHRTYRLLHPDLKKLKSSG